jgi:ABC-type sugar transport system ATPase subunit
LIELIGISKRYMLGGVEYPALSDVSLSIRRNDFLALTGASGSGKSTMMNIIGCLDSPTEGRYTLDGEEVAGLDEDQLASVRNRKIGFVFQNFYLMPRMTALDNVAQPLIYRGIGPAKRRAHAEVALQRVGLGDRMRHRPNEMSGGQRQRVAVGRAIVRKPKLFLFDEPLSNLDAKLRVAMRAEISKLHRRLGATIIYVTHDQVEAMTMADRIFIMNKGVVQQIGAPMEVYAKPANRFIAGFIGSPAMNFLPARVLPLLGSAEPPGAAEVGIRCEDLQPAHDGPLGGVVDAVENLGAQSHVHVRSEFGPLCALWGEGAPPSIGERLAWQVRQRRWHLFDAAGLRIPAI